MGGKMRIVEVKEPRVSSATWSFTSTIRMMVCGYAANYAANIAACRYGNGYVAGVVIGVVSGSAPTIEKQAASLPVPSGTLCLFLHVASSHCCKAI